MNEICNEHGIPCILNASNENIEHLFQWNEDRGILVFISSSRLELNVIVHMI